MTNSIHGARLLGQEIWIDHLSRGFIQSGKLQSWIENGVSGLTTNPAIFLKALLNDATYCDEITALKAQNKSPKECYESLACADVQAACDVFQNNGGGFVSIEIDPALADDFEASYQEALRLHQVINRPNLMIKVPATESGMQVLGALVKEGICVNMTLIFSRHQLQSIYQAYRSALSYRAQHGLSQDIAVVSSVFLSRFDTALDERLPVELQGKTAIALAQAAYADWQESFEHNPTLRLLWASTGTKNPKYSDTLYVDSLIGKHTVNTVTEPTLNAFLKCGVAHKRLPVEDYQCVLNQITIAGVDLEAVGNALQQQGLVQFENAFSQILNVFS